MLKIKLNINTVEKSISAHLFFCISAFPKPPSTNTVVIAINIDNSPIKPKSEG